MPLKKVKLFIRDEYFHHHSDGILSKNRAIKKLFDELFDKPVTLDFTARKKGSGISSPSVNAAIRKNLSAINNIKFEVNQLDGIYFVSGQTSGFDFALIDDISNIYNFRNLCFGKRRFSNGQLQWDDFLKKNPKYKAIAKRRGLPKLGSSDGIDLEIKKKLPIVLGEIQLGNWGLLYRDLFKVLQANVLTNVDLLIYIVADGDLKDKLSDGIVNFTDSKAMIQEFHKVITVPIWLLGIDYK